jgi:cystathionine gamma-synthase
VIAALEGAAAVLVFGSGMAAATAAFLALSPGDHIVAPRVMYWGLRSWLLTDAARWGLRTDFVDMRDGRAIAAAIIPGRTKMVWLESPANPLWDVPDIHRIAEIAHAANAVVAVDSTCATPLLTRPLEHGADIVMHSATKYLNGHSDVMAGALATARDDEFWQRIVRVRTTIGQLLGPLEGYLLVRGMRTFPLRVATACESAMILAKRLSTHPRVVEVLYPGLPSHPDHQVAQRKMHGGYGGMLSVRVASEEAAIGTAARVQLWKRAITRGCRKFDRTSPQHRGHRLAMPARPSPTLGRH